jgi:tellurite resistance protein TehA-like permease
MVSEVLFEEIEELDHFVGRVFYDLGLFLALMMWAFGLVWLFFAVATVIKTRTFPFNLGWWALTFPLGVFANCTVQLGDELSSTFFWVVGSVRHPRVPMIHEG